jgi:hypothetical protein
MSATKSKRAKATKARPAAKRTRTRRPAAKRKSVKATSKFRLIKCPIKGCTHMDGKPQEGTVPGVKRHVKAIHVLRDKEITEAQYKKLDFGESKSKPAGKQIADSIKAPKKSASNGSGDLASLPVSALRERAKAKGIATAGKRKEELVAALS